MPHLPTSGGSLCPSTSRGAVPTFRSYSRSQRPSGTRGCRYMQGRAVRALTYKDTIAHERQVRVHTPESAIARSAPPGFVVWGCTHLGAASWPSGVSTTPLSPNPAMRTVQVPALSPHQPNAGPAADVDPSTSLHLAGSVHHPCEPSARGLTPRPTTSPHLWRPRPAQLDERRTASARPLHPPALVAHTARKTQVRASRMTTTGTSSQLAIPSWSTPALSSKRHGPRHASPRTARMLK